MLEIYLKEKDLNGILRLKKYVHLNDAATLLKIKPSTLVSYISRGQMKLEIKKIKNLSFVGSDFLEDKISNLLPNSTISSKGSKQTSKVGNMREKYKVSSDKNPSHLSRF